MITLHFKDCFEVMKGMADGSVDLICTDPPYYSTDLHFDKAPRLDFKALLLEFKRILKPHGIFVTFADFNLLAELRSYKLFKSAYEIIWQKNMAVGFLDAKVRPLRSHEFIGVFVDGLKKSTYNPQKTKGEPYHNKQGKMRPSSCYGKLDEHFRTDNHEGWYYPKSVFGGFYDPDMFNSSITNKPRHPTQKPLDLIEYLIKTYSNEGDVVFDPFMGSGTTGLGCKNLNRSFIGCEIFEDYFNIAQSRINGVNPPQSPNTPLTQASPIILNPNQISLL